MNTQARHLIGLDLGTSAIKGVLVDDRGRVLAEAGVDTALLHPREGWVEVEPEGHYRRVCQVIRTLAAAAPGPVVAIAMAAASGNTLLTRADGTPLTHIINWMDHRGEQERLPALDGLDADEVWRIAGWPWLGSFPLAHLAWLRERRPELYRAAGHYAMDTDWLLHRLTGEWRMDHSTATTFYLQDQVAGAYCEPLLRRLDLPLEKLSPLVFSGKPIGPLTPEAARDTGLSPDTLVVSGCFDHPAAARSVGVLEPGELMLSCGTSWVGFTPAARRQTLLDAQMLCDPFLSAQGGPWGGMLSVPYIGRAIDWYIDNLIAPGEADRLAAFNEAAAAASPGAGGLEIDLREPPHPIDADRANIARAVMEGAARLLDERLASLADVGMSFERAVMVGGPSASPLWTRIVEDRLGLTVTRGGRSAGARGAAMLAGLGAGLYRDEHDARAAWGEDA